MFRQVYRNFINRRQTTSANYAEIQNNNRDLSTAIQKRVETRKRHLIK